MSGQLAIAELDAFRAVLCKAQPGEGETVKLWCRSTVTNAVHRVGPSGPIKAAAEAAWDLADKLARALDAPATDPGCTDLARERAVEGLDALVVAIRQTKAIGSTDIPEL